MIVKSLRLKNIKSYGSGPQGEGITVDFTSGVNRVAGRNGHGKSTLIEALGYALFLAEPQFDENFRLPAYFLRADEKEGEIHVTFEHGGEEYRLERGIGQSKLRSKVVQSSDGSTCEEGDEGVSRFLCEVLDFKDKSQLADIFSNLIGVKQGRLAWPFDSRPAAAKEFFEPLLNVAIFRQSESCIREAQTRFKDLLQEQQTKLGAQHERIRLLADSAEVVPIKEAQVEELSRLFEKSRQQREAAEQAKRAAEQQQASFEAARNARDSAQHRLNLAAQRRESDQKAAEESQLAATEAKRSEPGFVAYAKAEADLQSLHEQQKQKATLERQRTDAVALRTQAETRLEIGRKLSSENAQQRVEAGKQIEAQHRRLADAKTRFEAGRSEFDRLGKVMVEMSEARAALEAWSANLGSEVESNQRRCAEILELWEGIRSWDGRTLANALAEEIKLSEADQELRRRLARAEEAKTTLAAQLAQISGGVCPFLKEKCRQFDPKAIQSDLLEHEKEFAEIGRRQQESAAILTQARKTVETLRQQESTAARQRQKLIERFSQFLEHHNRLAPATVLAQCAILQTHLPEGFEFPAPVNQASAGDIWNEREARLEPKTLRVHAEAETTFLAAVRDWRTRAWTQLTERSAQFERQKAQRLQVESALASDAQALKRLETELKLLAERIQKLDAETVQDEQQVQTATRRVLQLDTELAVFANLDPAIRQAQEAKARNVASHKAYLGAGPLAAKLEGRLASLKQSTELEKRTSAEAQQAARKFEEAGRDFSAADLEKARETAAGLAAKLKSDEKDLQSSKQELQKQRERLKQWKEAGREADRFENEISRLQAAIQVAKLAGKVLKDSAPAVAQHLCNRIAVNAQRIFNQISQEAIELEWKAEPQYSLRVVPGDRRFAMLSGGEQTKLALAMTLAMIQEFSNLRFAVFDEPTYGVDAESREKLADAILEAQKAAGLEQLIVVSHDDAFEGKIEHVVLLEKHAGSGTNLVIQD